MAASTPPVRVRVVIDPDLLEDEDSPQRKFQDYVVAEFLEYKKLSLTSSIQNFVAKNEGLQAKEVSAHNQFGRDRVFDHPHKLLAKIIHENVAHVHYDSEGAWPIDRVQWSCTSHESVVYSAFQEIGGYCFVIHELLLDLNQDPSFNAHDNYSFDDLDYYVKNAKYFREIEQNK